MRRSIWILMLLVPGPPAGAQKLARLTEELRLDATKEDFARIAYVTVGPHQEIVILVRDEMRIRAYDKNGRRLRAFGRVGSGPGEFRSPAMVGWSADTLWVHDHALRRLTWFGPDLKLLRTEPTTPPRMRGAVTPQGQVFGVTFYPYALLADGAMFGRGGVSRSTQDTQPWQYFLGIQAKSGDVSILPMSPNFEDPRWDMFQAGFSRSVPFTTPPQVAIAPDGSRFGLMTVENARDGGVISVTTYTFGGSQASSSADGRVRVDFAKKIPFKGERLPSSVRDSVMASFGPPRGRRAEGPPTLEQRWAAMARDRMPSFYNPVESLLLGVDKTVWVFRPTRNDRWSADVYDGRGNLLGRVEPPPRTQIRQGSGTHLWATQRDDDDLASVVRYRIEWPK